MKKFGLILFLAVLGISSCSYDDDEYNINIINSGNNYGTQTDSTKTNQDKQKNTATVSFGVDDVKPGN